MNIYQITDYREIIRYLVEERKKSESKFGFHKLSEAANIQKPYISKVLKGNANLNSDQMYAIAKCLRQSKEETEYILLCLEYDRTVFPDRKKDLKDRIRQIATESQDSSKHLKAKSLDTSDPNSTISKYYLDPLNQIIHSALTIPYYSINPLILSKHLHINNTRLHDIIQFLKRENLLEEIDGKLIPKNRNLHLPRSSPLYNTWRNQLKLLAMQRINDQQEQSDTYSFNVIFTGNENTRNNIHNKFMEFLQYCESEVKNSTSIEKIFQMSFDLFPWTAGGPSPKKL